MAYKVLEACSEAQWRLLFALSHFGGLRCPSEHLALTLDAVDWEAEHGIHLIVGKDFADRHAAPFGERKC